jgi:serine phosphatase RsbU (regulator of sigma subunit)
MSDERQPKGRPVGRQGTSAARIAVACALAFVVATLYDRSPVREYVETQLGFPFLFKARQAVGRSAPIHPRLKIYSFDDSTFAALGRPDLTLRQWADLLTALDARRPSLIFIDAIFGIVPQEPVAEERAALIERIARLRTPIVTAGFLRPSVIKGREAWEPRGSAYSIRDYYADAFGMLRFGFPPFVARRNWITYGPHPELRGAFSRVGHVLNAGGGLAEALLQVSPTTVVPHMALLGGTLSVERGRLRLDGEELPLDRDGQLLVDFAKPSAYYQNSRHLLDALRAVEGGKPIDRVQEHDVVLVLPLMFTGNADITETPVGPLPGGLTNATLINSRLRGEWLRPVESVLGVDAPIVCGIALGAAAAFSPAAWAIPAAVGLGLAWIATTFAVFTWLGWYLGLSAPLLAYGLTAAMMLSERFRVRERLIGVMRLLKAQNEELQSELTQAGEIARVFVPARPPKWQGFTVGVFHKPLTSASGDWYAFETSASGRFQHLVMCDISGHGAQAAIIVSTCKTVLSLMVDADAGSLEDETFIDRYASLLNRTLCRHGAGRHTTTFLGVTFDAVAGQVRVICAGHPRPIHLSPTQLRAAYLGKPMSILGHLPGLVVRASAHPFQPGDSILAYTDGIPFPRALGRVQEIFDAYRHLDPESAARSMAADARERAPKLGAYRVIDDDASLIWVRWKKRVVDGAA